MARTFLALINEGAAVETDKDIIFAALFRATQDGIINDDGPPILPFRRSRRVCLLAGEHLRAKLQTIDWLVAKSQARSS